MKQRLIIESVVCQDFKQAIKGVIHLPKNCKEITKIVIKNNSTNNICGYLTILKENTCENVILEQLVNSSSVNNIKFLEINCFEQMQGSNLRYLFRKLVTDQTAEFKIYVYFNQD